MLFRWWACAGNVDSLSESCLCAQGKRYSLPNSRIMIHQPLGGAQGQAADIEIQANEILHHKLTLNGYLSEFTSQSMERITQVPRSFAAHAIAELSIPHSLNSWRP